MCVPRGSVSPFSETGPPASSPLPSATREHRCHGRAVQVDVDVLAAHVAKEVQTQISGDLTSRSMYEEFLQDAKLQMAHARETMESQVLAAQRAETEMKAKYEKLSEMYKDISKLKE